MVEHTPTPWAWVIHDSSMASIEGPKSEFDHVLSISPCKHCQGDEWRWGACTVPKANDADFIVKAVNNHDALVKALETIINLSDSEMKDGDEAREIARKALALVGQQKPQVNDDV